MDRQTLAKGSIIQKVMASLGVPASYGSAGSRIRRGDLRQVDARDFLIFLKRSRGNRLIRRRGSVEPRSCDRVETLKRKRMPCDFNNTRRRP